MQFQVPQFIDIEDRIMGPLTLRQFLYLAAAGAFSFILFFMLQVWLWITITIIMGLISATFAFIKYNGQPMPKMFGAALKYLWLPKFYLWRYSAPAKPELIIHEIPKLPNQVSQNPLKNLLFKLQTSTSAITGREKDLSLARKVN
jgi:hypothetical protein